MSPLYLVIFSQIRFYQQLKILSKNQLTQPPIRSCMEEMRYVQVLKLYYLLDILSENYIHCAYLLSTSSISVPKSGSTN